VQIGEIPVKWAQWMAGRVFAIVMAVRAVDRSRLVAEFSLLLPACRLCELRGRKRLG